MAELTATQGGAEIQDGTYSATLLGVTTQEPTAKSPNEKQWLKWFFLVDDGSETGVELSATSSYKCTSKSKPRAWIEAVLGRQLKNGETVTLEDLKALDCFVHIIHDEKDYAKIESVMPLPKRTGGKAAALPPPTPPAPEPSDTTDDGGIPFWRIVTHRVTWGPRIARAGPFQAEPPP